MGYYTYFSMEARGIKNEEEYNSIIKAMQERELYWSNRDHDSIFDDSKYFDDAHSAIFEAYQETKWYDHSYDMMKLSRLFPDVTFKLHGEGEESDDLWNEYYHNGKIEECRAQIIYETPCEIEWNE